jgi:hypothetical protein
MKRSPLVPAKAGIQLLDSRFRGNERVKQHQVGAFSVTAFRPAINP